MAQKQYWKGLEELENTPEYQQTVENEFPQELPGVGKVSDKLFNAETPRRDFLKFLGFSTLAATVAASCEMPVRKAIPYAIKPEDITPGVANWYASSYIDNGEYCSVVVKTREGRPIMVEGNKASKVTNGAVSARVVASTLSLYDKARLRQPLAKGAAVDKMDAVDTPIQQALAAANGSIYLVTGTVLSPTTKSVIDTFKNKYPSAKHIQYDPISYYGLALANEVSFGKKAIPSYHFENAKTIFSLGADFLGSWLAPNEFSHGYNVNRKITAKKPEMSKHYQVEAMMSMTGSNADERATCKPSEYGKVAAALYEAVVSGATPKVGSEKLNALLASAAKELKNNGLVVCGSNDANVQYIVNAINNAIGAYGNTISWATTSNYKQGNDQEFVNFVNEMNAGQVGAVLIHGVNPSYDYFDSEKFNTGLAKVGLTVSFAERLDETAANCQYVVPDHHWLESWGDAEPKTGYYSFLQPTIAPLFKTRAFQDSLLTWAGATEDYYTVFSKYWVGKLGQSNFDKALQDGVLEPATASISGGSFNGGQISTAIAEATAVKGGRFEVVMYESVAIGHGGSHSNNPWLLEMPDPVTRATWDNYVCMSYKTAKEEFGYELTLHNQVVHDKKVVKVVVNGKEVSLPLVVLPGMHNDVIAIAVGYGRSEGVGKAAANLGANVYKFGQLAGNTFLNYNTCTIEVTNEWYPVAITQTHHSYEGREIIQEFTLEEFKKDPNFLLNKRKKDLGHYTTLHWEGHHEEDKNLTPGEQALKHDKDFEKNGTMYPVHEKHGIKWGMSIDLNSCTGCGACVVACQAENNVSIVGKEQVMMAHDMSWIRIDRYFSGNPDDPDTIQTVYQPMICQHCDNAPCENVCPVSATNHSDEGLNQMAYNRCIGTKYCANNCPYKVRRFNWFDWNGADSFADNLYYDGRTDDINDDITRMVLNPDVTVRSRGVMEKCSFCVQRLQEGKLKAKMESRPLKDSDISTACQRACAGDCIKFGNVNDTESEIFKERYEENSERLFYVLEYLHILPNVNYLSKIRNTSTVVAKDKEQDIFQLKNI